MYKKGFISFSKDGKITLSEVKIMDIEKRLDEIFAQKIKKEKVDKTISLENLGLDSLDKIELLYGLEDEFNIEFTNDEMKNFVTVGDVYDAIIRKVKK